MDRRQDNSEAYCGSGLTLVLGPPNSGKMGRALEWWQDKLPLRPLVVAPTAPVARELTKEMIRRAGALLGQSPALTFAGLVDAVMGRSSRQLGEFERRLLMARLLQEVPLRSLSATAQLPGAGAALARLLRQLGESGKEPDALYRIFALWAREDPSAAGLAADIGRIHRAYLDACVASGLTDGPSATREAVALAGGWSRPVVLYGFTSFTTVQQKLIAALCQSAPVLMVLPRDSTRSVNLNTTVEVEAWKAKARDVVESLPRVRAYSSPAIAYLERHLLSNLPRSAPPEAAPGPEGVRFLLASGQRNEAELVAQHISGLLGQGFRPEDIAVVVRRLRNWSSLLSQVFGSCGIPYHVDDVRTLGETAFGHALVRALEGVFRDDAESLFVYLRSPYSGLTPEMVADLELCYRRGNSRGAALLARLGEEMCPGALGPLWAAVSTRPGPGSLQPDGLEELCERMLKTAAQQGIVGDLDFEEDARAFRALEGVISVLRATGATGPADPVPESGMVVRALAGVPIPAGRIGVAQAVQVLDVHRARARRFAVVVVMGLCEGEFPGHTDPPTLLTRAQGRHMDALAGGGLFTAEANQEAGLFVSAVSRAWQLLLLSARDADDGGGEAVPSRFWSLSRQLLGADGRQCETRTLAEVVFRAEAAPSPRHYRRACAAEGLSPVRGPGFSGDGDRTRPWQRPPAALTDPAVIADLERTESFTPSSLETYLNCPFTWFVERVVGVEELEPGLDARSTGQLFHSALSITYGELSARGALPLRPEGLADAEAIAHAAIERLVGGDECPGSAAEKRLTAWQLRSMVGRLLHMESEAGSALLTVEMEATVGDEGGVDTGGLRVRGRIDRIDADPGGGSLFVVDYKSGTVPEPSSLGSQRALQLPLYLMALAAERPAAQVVGGAYLSPREERCSGLVRAGSEHLVGPGRQGCRVLDPEAIELVFAETRALACEAAAGMRAGRIAPHSERECPAWCGLGPVCRSRRGGYRPWRP